MSIVTQYILLKLVLLAIFIYSGYGISKKNKNLFWSYAVLSIIAYTLIQGLRYGRGADFFHYKDAYEGLVFGNREILFELINQILGKFLGLPYYWIFIVYSLLTIFPVILLFKNYRNIALYALPVFLIITHIDSENLVRQYIAASFVLLSTAKLMSNNWKYAFTDFLCAFFFHNSCIFLLPFIIILKLFTIPKISPWWLIGFYLLIVFLWKNDYWGGFASYMKEIKVSDQYAHYTENSTRWLTEEGSLSLRQGRETITTLIGVIRWSIHRSVLIYCGMKILKWYKPFQLPFFLFYISIIVLQMAGDIEIIMRMGKWFNMFEIIVAGFVLTYTPRNNSYIKYLLLFVVVNYCYTFLSLFLTNLNPKACSFIWNY